jgi:hypothetical protein
MESVEICPPSETGVNNMNAPYEICRIQPNLAQLVKLTTILGCLLGNVAISTTATAIPPELVKEYEEWGLIPPPSTVAADNTSTPDDDWSEPSPVSDDEASPSTPREQAVVKKALVGLWRTSDLLIADEWVALTLFATFKFNEQGEFRFKGTEKLIDGTEDNFDVQGKFRIDGDVLIITTNQGTSEMRFSFVGENLHVDLLGTESTLVLVRS